MQISAETRILQSMKKKIHNLKLITFTSITILAITVLCGCNHKSAPSEQESRTEESARTQQSTGNTESAESTDSTGNTESAESAASTGNTESTESAASTEQADATQTTGQQSGGASETQTTARQIADIKQQPAGTEVDVSGFSEEETAQLFYATEITDDIFARINGVSYQENNEISRENLRYLRVLHIGMNENTYVGEMIVNESTSEDVLEIMQELYRAAYPIEKMVLIDEYGGDDEASMEANNTSAFNYRNISGSGKRSKHSYGLAIDVNPLYNPYVKNTADAAICQPQNALDYIDRNREFSYKIDENDLCYQLFTAHGFTWGGSWNSVKDYQHFEK